MPFCDVQQKNEDWLRMRVGAATASRMFDIVDRYVVNTQYGKKGDYKASRRNYMVELICERLTNLTAEHFVTPFMDRGSIDESAARDAYQLQTDEAVLHGGLYIHDSIDWFMASPDGRVGDIGLLEIKNLKPEKHYAFLRGAPIPDEYIWQCNAQLACAPEREWVDYGSFCKEYTSPKLRLFVRRHYRDKERIAELEREVSKFNAEIAFELMELSRAEPIKAESVGV